MEEKKKITKTFQSLVDFKEYLETFNEDPQIADFLARIERLNDYYGYLSKVLVNKQIMYSLIKKYGDKINSKLVRKCNCDCDCDEIEKMKDSLGDIDTLIDIKKEELEEKIDDMYTIVPKYDSEKIKHFAIVSLQEPFDSIYSWDTWSATDKDELITEAYKYSNVQSDSYRYVMQNKPVMIYCESNTTTPSVNFIPTIFPNVYPFTTKWGTNGIFAYINAATCSTICNITFGPLPKIQFRNSYNRNIIIRSLTSLVVDGVEQNLNPDESGYYELQGISSTPNTNHTIKASADGYYDIEVTVSQELLNKYIIPMIPVANEDEQTMVIVVTWYDENKNPHDFDSHSTFKINDQLYEIGYGNSSNSDFINLGVGNGNVDELNYNKNWDDQHDYAGGNVQTETITIKNVNLLSDYQFSMFNWDEYANARLGNFKQYNMEVSVILNGELIAKYTPKQETGNEMWWYVFKFNNGDYKNPVEVNTINTILKTDF